MKFIIKKIFPTGTSLLLITVISAFLFLVIIGLIPSQVSLANMDKKIQRLKVQMEEHKRLQSVYEMIKQDASKHPKILPFPAKSSLSREKLNTIMPTFTEIAKMADLEILSMTPDLKSLGEESRYVSVNVSLRGEFFNFRKLLIALGELPYLEKIEDIHIQQDRDAMEFKIKVWINLS